MLPCHISYTTTITAIKINRRKGYLSKSNVFKSYGSAENSLSKFDVRIGLDKIVLPVTLLEGNFMGQTLD